MTQNTTGGRMYLLVACHTGLHFCRYFLGEHLPQGDRAVATYTADARSGVICMAEKNEIGNAVQANPRNLFPRLLGVRQFPDRRTVRFNGDMAEHALLRLRETGLLPLLSSLMTVETVQSGTRVL